MILGIDVSTYLEELSCGAKYYDNSKEIDPLDLFRQNGVDYMRIRVWNDPYNEEGKPYLGGTCDVNNFIKLAKLAQSKGYKIMLDLHYSDFWADPGKQFLPKKWKNLSFAELEKEIYLFTNYVLIKAKEEHIVVNMIQIGNEITNGICWPHGKLIYDEKTGKRTNYENLALLLKAGIKAAREIFPKAEILIHLEKSYDQFIYNEFLSNMEKNDVIYDILGVSYYPFWHGTFEQLFLNLRMCQNVYKKRIIVTELGYGFTTEDYLKTEKDNHLVFNKEDIGYIGNKMPYPLTVEGQQEYIKEFLKLAEENNIEGVFYWEPLWIPARNSCWASVEGQKYINEVGSSIRNEWANQCLFDYNGNKLKAFDAYKIVK